MNGDNAELLQIAQQLRLDLAECNQGKARLREWIANEMKAQNAN